MQVHLYLTQVIMMVIPTMKMSYHKKPDLDDLDNDGVLDADDDFSKGFRCKDWLRW